MDFCKAFNISYDRFKCLKRASSYVHSNKYNRLRIKMVFVGF